MRIWVFVITVFYLFIQTPLHAENVKVQDQTWRVDSAIYYFNKSQTKSGVDSLIFLQGIGMMDSIPVDAESVQRLKSVAESFKKLKNTGSYVAIINALLAAFSSQEEYYKEIDFGKEIIQQYDTKPDPADRLVYLNVLINLRVPYRVSDSLAAGFNFYTTKLGQYLERNDSGAVSICYFVHGGFYYTKGLNDLAIYYYKKAISYLNPADTADSEKLTNPNNWRNHTSVVGSLSNAIGDYKNAILYSRSALPSKMTNQRDSARYAYVYLNIAIAKTMLNERDSVIFFLDKVYDLVAGPNENSLLANCYQAKGIYYQRVKQNDSAEFYFRKCIDLMERFHIQANNTQGRLVPNYFLAQLCVEQNRLKEAEEFLTKDIPKLLNLRIEILKEYKLLIEIYLQTGKPEQANEIFKKYIALEEELQADERKYRSISFETEQTIANAEGTIRDLKTEQRVSSLTRNFLTVGLIIMLLFSVVFFRQRNNIAKGKKKSDELLLNILPSEVAEELKAKGSAEAKYYDEVTVMFTDFKGFTRISEKLTPTELVSEIHTCFKAFDQIITKYGIEKIKTIGDAYMCAGGLPVANTTNALDVVNAALEMQQFMQQHLKQRESEKREVFEMRIGIHTGPVVSGIVGVKKFAYDIWGDTVNIASRMESSGEAGKVNISGSTFALVKDKFECIQRGKIQAKNKGEIEMYFVEGAV